MKIKRIVGIGITISFLILTLSTRAGCPLSGPAHTNSTCTYKSPGGISYACDIIAGDQAPVAGAFTSTILRASSHPFCGANRLVDGEGFALIPCGGSWWANDAECNM
jgi:hypothetical protein